MHQFALLTLSLLIMNTHAPAQQDGVDAPGTDQPAPASDLGIPDPTGFLHQLFEQHYNWELHEFPEEAMSKGIYTQAHRITDQSLAAISIRHNLRERFLRNVNRIDRNVLSPEDQLNYDLFKAKLSREIEGNQYQMYLAPLGGRFGPQTEIPEMAERVRFESEQDYENYLSRLSLTAESIAHYIDRMSVGLTQGITPPRVTLAGVPMQFDEVIKAGLPELAEPFKKMPAHISAAKAAALQARFDEEVLPALLEALKRFEQFVVNEYIPKTRESIAAVDLPKGKEFYNFRLREMTTTDLAAEQIHQIGLDEVARIRAEMMTVIRKSDFLQVRSDATSLDDQQLFKAFLEYLRTDPRFYCKTEEELLDRYRAICKETDPWLIKLFGHLPRLPYGVKEIPGFIAPHTTTAYYQHGSIENAEPGWFYANTYALDQRPTYEMIPLALHEAVPGHHLQIAIAQELVNLPEFRKDMWFTAYGEGWALYAERLGIEMGMYEDPYDDFGRLIYEMWRACRLVVDPGMHALGWSREKAIQFMLDNTALSELNITNEVDRYIAWPGQAPAYKIGEIKIRELREEAESQLGEKFDLRAFHDVVLGAGAIPLTVLEGRVREWIAERVEN